MFSYLLNYFRSKINNHRFNKILSIKEKDIPTWKQIQKKTNVKLHGDCIDHGIQLRNGQQI